MTPCEIQKIIPCTCVTPLIVEDMKEEIERAMTPEEPRVVPAAWGEFRKRWPQKSILRIRFLNGTSKQRSMFMDRANVLDGLCGLAFKVITSGPSEIRPLFNPSAGHWSYVGIDCKGIQQQFQTMNIGLTERDSSTEWNRVVLHEMMHALAFNHEHQHPRSKIPWNRPAVFDFYGETQGWSRPEIEAQVLRRSTATNIFGSDPDKNSLMMYPIPAELVTDPKYAVSWNTKLSKWDIETLRKVYPL